jgi:hypothetical protein
MTLEIDVVLLHRFAAIVELLVFLAFGGNELTRCKGSYGLFVGQNTIVDILGELLQKGVLHGQGPFLVHSVGFFFMEHPIQNCP